MNKITILLEKIITSLLLFITAIFLQFSILPYATVYGEDPLIELRVQHEKYLGKRLVHDHEKVVLMLRDGEVKVIPLSTISGFRKTGESFKPLSLLQMRSELEQEFSRENKDYEVKSNNTFVIVSPLGTSEKYLTICDDLKRSFYHYFISRGIKLKEIEFPLVIIMFKDQKSFFDYGKAHKIKEINLLSGLYHPTTNRIVMHQDEKVAQQIEPEISNLLPTKQVFKLSLKAESGIHQQCYLPDEQTICGGLGNSKTIIETLSHEVTHQLAFNSNLHSRTGEYPRWIIEGLAMTFESPGNRSNSKYGDTMDRVNLDRYLHFKTYISNKRPSQYLEKFLFSEDQFKDSNQILDAYAESWALTFYLIETRRADYAKYLQLLYQRPSFSYYKSSDRINDFKAIFGNNLNIFEVQYLQYYQKLY